MKCLSSLILATLLAWTSSVLAGKKNDAVLLSKVKSLTLRDGRQTSHRRVEPLDQLNCVGGNGCQFYQVDVMRCTNSGSEYDSEDVQWTCKASLPPEFKLGSTDVICEGYDNADDPFILKGSCGVEYRLLLTELGEEKYRDHIRKNAWGGPSRDGGKKDGGDEIAAILFWVIFAAIVCTAIVCIILYSIFFSGPAEQRPWNQGHRGGGGGGGGGGWGGGDDNNDPPPPYTPRANPRPKKSTSSWSSYTTPSNVRGNQQNQGWRPGFWSGTAAGAAAGYAAGSYANRTQPQQQQSNWFGGAPANRGGSSYLGGGSSSGWGGGGGASSSSAPAPSSSRSESTGFGGTRRR